MTTIIQHCKFFSQIIRLPSASLNFSREINPEKIVETYLYFTMPHPRYRLIQHKTIGAALIDLKHIGTKENYLSLISGKNGGSHHAERARTRGYTVSEISLNVYIDAIHEINNSCPSRQGRPMDIAYQKRSDHFDELDHVQSFGVFNNTGELVAYANIARFGNFFGFSQLIGLRNNDGIMHLMLIEIIFNLLQQKKVRYVMYDTYFGALPGLRRFKTTMGFRPYRVKYKLI